MPGKKKGMDGNDGRDWVDISPKGENERLDMCVRRGGFLGW